MTSNDIIRLLQLDPNPTEGGHFRRTYESDLRIDYGYGSKPLLTSIYYLLTQESPMGLLHRNKSDILHYHQLGSAVKYTMISPDGILLEHILGPDIAHGDSLQLLVPGGWWKASRLCGGEYALISEAVAPGFDYADNEIATEEMVQRLCPEFGMRLEEYAWCVRKN